MMKSSSARNIERMNSSVLNAQNIKKHIQFCKNHPIIPSQLTMANSFLSGEVIYLPTVKEYANITKEIQEKINSFSLVYPITVYVDPSVINQYFKQISIKHIYTSYLPIPFSDSMARGQISITLNNPVYMEEVMVSYMKQYQMILPLHSFIIKTPSLYTIGYNYMYSPPKNSFEHVVGLYLNYMDTCFKQPVSTKCQNLFGYIQSASRLGLLYPPKNNSSNWNSFYNLSNAYLEKQQIGVTGHLVSKSNNENNVDSFVSSYS